MFRITEKQFKELVTSSRYSVIPTATTVVNTQFQQLQQQITTQGFTWNSWVANHASEFVKQMRDGCWNSLRQAEQNFNLKMIESLFDPQQFPQMTGADVVNAIATNFNYFYILSQANTQSRRSRAGKEFELILALMLVSCDIPVAMQVLLGTGIHKKAVDLVVPDLSSCSNSKQPRCLFALSAKTNLRERWQEVVTEAQQAQVNELYLLTLEPNISPATIANLAQENIFLVTTIDNKQSWNLAAYDDHILSFEELVEHIQQALFRLSLSQLTLQQKQAACDYLKGLKHKMVGLQYIQFQYSKFSASLRKS